MTDHPCPCSVESLLAQRPWVEALARSLVRDAATADDVVQQTWLAAFSNPPRDATAVRGWLARVVRNAAAESHRRTVRRTAREAAAPPARAEPGPAEIVEKAEAHRRIVEAVMALAEPYRGTVLLRWFEGLEADEVARRTGVPIETARTRLKRAHAMLRERLDRECGGDGRAWVVALVPLAGAPHAGKFAVVQGGIVMGSMKTLAAGAAGLVLGIVATWGMVAAGALPGGAANPAPPPGSDAPAAEPAPATTQAPATAPPPSTGDVAGDAAARLLAGHRPELPPVSAAPLRVRVRTKDGDPLPGAVVRTVAIRLPRPGEYRRGIVRPQPSAEDSIRGFAEYVNWTAATTREARTDGSGECVLRDVFDADQNVTAMAEGWSMRNAPGTTWPILPGMTVEFVATRVVAVPIEVVLGDGSVPGGHVTVRWSAPQRGGGSSFTWQRADREAEVEPGTWQFTAQIGRDVRSEPVTVTIPADAAPPTVTLRLAAANSVSGVARPDAADAWWTEVEVHLVRRGARSCDGAVARATAGPPTFEYRMEKMADGEYDVAVSVDGDTVFASAPVTVRGGPARCDLTVPAVPRDAYVAVRVIGPDGLPVAPGKVSFAVRCSYAGGIGGIGTRAFPLADGRFVVPIRRMRAGLDATPVGAVQWSLEARHHDGGTRVARFVPGQTEPVEISFANEARFEPRWTGVDGTPLAGRVRAVLGLAWQPYGAAFNNRDTRSLTPGRYVVTVCIERPGELIPRPVARIPVELRPGDNVVPLTVPPLHTLTIRVPGAVAGTELSVMTARRPRDMPVPGVTVNESGIATASELPAGTYRIQATIQGEEREMVVALDSSRELTFTPTTLAGLDVAVEDERGTLFTAGLRDGDRIVAIDGVEIDTVRRADTVLYAARTRSKIDADVLRGGTRLRLTIEPGVLLLDGELGGSWTPVPK